MNKLDRKSIKKKFHCENSISSFSLSIKSLNDVQTGKTMMKYLIQQKNLVEQKYKNNSNILHSKVTFQLN